MAHITNPRIFNIDTTKSTGAPITPETGTIIHIRDEYFYVEKPQPHYLPCVASHLCTCLDFSQCRRCSTTLTRLLAMPYQHRYGYPVYTTTLHNQTLFFSPRLKRDTDNPCAPSYSPTFKSLAALMAAISKTQKKIAR